MPSKRKKPNSRPKKSAQEKPNKRQEKKTSSAQLCKEYGLVDPNIQYDEDDHKNLSTYNIFVQHIRPQIVKVNPNLRSYRNLASLLAVCWREFQESNPFTEKAATKKENLSKKSATVISEDSDTETEPKSKKKKQITTRPKKEAKLISDSESQSSKDSKLTEKDDSRVNTEDEDTGKEEERATTSRSHSKTSKEPDKGKRKSWILKLKPLMNKASEKKLEDSKKATKNESDSDDEIDFKETKSTSTRKAKKAPIVISSDSEADSHKTEEHKEAKAGSDDDDYEMSDEEDIEVSRPSRTCSRTQTRSKERTQLSRATKDKTRKDEDSDDFNADDSDDGDLELVSGRPKRKRKQIKDLSKEMTNREFNRLLTERDTGESKKRTSRNIQKRKRSDESNDSDSEAEWKKIAKIPERKSGRHNKPSHGYREMSNAEFEQVLKKGLKKKKKKIGSDGSEYEPSEESVSSVEVKVNTFEARGKRIRRKKKKIRTRVTKRKDEGSRPVSGDESDHDYWCDVCHDGGEVLVCDTCPRVFHQVCLEITDIPDGKWSCPECVAENSDHEQWCRVCRDGGDMILCERCPNVYHLTCLNPPLAEIPDGDWLCPYCSCEPLKGSVSKILTWRWKEPPKGGDTLDHTPSSPLKKKFSAHPPQKEFFVTYKGMSYWQCDWVDEFALTVFHPSIFRNFIRKNDMNEPLPLEDGSTYGLQFSHRKKNSKEEGLNLEERFYRYGIKPEWLQIHRIINHQNGSPKKYLVKWNETYYEQCTWEDEYTAKFVPDYKEKVKDYEDRRELFRKKDTKAAKKEIKPKKHKLKVKLDKQQDYVDATGGTLHPYQLEGLNWLRFSWGQDTNTILADEMGLGKTIQTAVFLYSLWKEGYTKGPFLISAPLSTVTNWERELAFWAPELYVVTYTGGKDSRALIRENEFSYQADAMAKMGKRVTKFKEMACVKFDILLTSYELVSVDKTLLSSIKWACLIIDEAHRLKNNQSLFFRVMSEYDLRYKLLLTGTPLQNNLEELFNLLNFMSPTKFSDSEAFMEDFAEISKEDQVKKLHDLLAPHLLRRVKADVLKDIPSKSETVVRVELSPMQKKFYKYILTKNFELLNARGMVRCSLMMIMMDLRKCCNHPYLFPSACNDAPLSKTGAYEGRALVKACGKLELLEKMLKVLKRDGHRVLIFSQMTRVLDILEEFLDYLGYGFERIDGNISGNERQMSIDRFNSTDSQKFVFLLSTKAGGLGINLASADTVIIYDMDWNPHNDIQAFSRAHRIGQKNKVMVYRFVSRNSIEEKMTQVAKKKMMLHNLVVRPGAGVEDSMSKNEINDILKFGTENLFKEGDESDTHKVTYDDKAIEQMLDRSEKTEEEGGKHSEGLDDYFSSFKVASYIVKEGVEKEEEEEEQPPVKQPEEYEIDHWEKLLGASHEKEVLKKEQEKMKFYEEFGRGKRTRSRIEYNERKMLKVIDSDDEDQESQEVVIEDAVYMQSDYEPSSSSEEGSAEEVVEMDDSAPWYMKSNKLLTGKENKEKLPLPPLLCKKNGQLEVLGLNARERKSFLHSIMAFGMPPGDITNTQWIHRDLKHKPAKVLRAYVSLFMKHLCETPIKETFKEQEHYSDGIPTEGLSPTAVLTRIGMITLIRKKVKEFENLLGTDATRVGYILKQKYEIKKKEIALVELDGKDENSDKVDIRDTENQSEHGKTNCNIDGSITDELKKVVLCQNEEKMDTVDKQESSTPVDIETKESETPKEAEAMKEPREMKEESSTVVDNETKESETPKEEEVKGEPLDIKEENKVPVDQNQAMRESESDIVKKQDTSNKELTGEKVEMEKKKLQKAIKAILETKEDVNTVSDTVEERAKDHSATVPVVGPNGSTVVDNVHFSQTDPIEEDFRQMLSVFHIEEGGLTNLKGIWKKEDFMIGKLMDNNHEHYIYSRLHDYFLLAGNLVYGYKQWPNICQDLKYRVIMDPFKLISNLRKDKIPFWNRRLQLLEQALVIEQFLENSLVTLGQDVEVDPNERYKQLRKIAKKIKKMADKPHLLEIKKNMHFKEVVTQLKNITDDFLFQQSLNSKAILPCLEPAKSGSYKKIQSKDEKTREKSGNVPKPQKKGSLMDTAEGVSKPIESATLSDEDDFVITESATGAVISLKKESNTEKPVSSSQILQDNANTQNIDNNTRDESNSAKLCEAVPQPQSSNIDYELQAGIRVPEKVPKKCVAEAQETNQKATLQDEDSNLIKKPDDGQSDKIDCSEIQKQQIIESEDLEVQEDKKDKETQYKTNDQESVMDDGMDVQSDLQGMHKDEHVEMELFNKKESIMYKNTDLDNTASQDKMLVETVLAKETQEPKVVEDLADKTNQQEIQASVDTQPEKMDVDEKKIDEKGDDKGGEISNVESTTVDSVDVTNPYPMIDIDATTSDVDETK